MGIIAEYFRENSFLNLADSETKNYGKASRPKTINSNSTLRKDKNDTIRALYESDWFTFSSVNIMATLYSKPRYRIETYDNSETLVWDEFFANMRLYNSSSSSLKRLRADVKKDAVAYGTGYIEFVPSSSGDEILYIKRVDSSRLRKAKDAKGNLVLDEQGNSIGYIIALGATADLTGKGDTIPPKFASAVKVTTGDIFILPERIAAFPLYGLPNGEESMGIVEPAIQQTQRRQKIEDAQVNAIYIRGTAPLFALVGDPTHEPNPQMLEDAADSLSEMRNQSVAAFPYFQEPKTIDAKVDDTSTKIMDMLMAAEAGAGNIPLPFVTGAGQETNRSTLKTQREMFEINLQEKIDNFDEDWNLKVMDVISEINNLPRAKIISDNLTLESRDDTASRLQTWVNIQALSPEEVRPTALRLEKIKPDEEAYKAFRESSPDNEEGTETEDVKKEDDKQDKSEEDKETKNEKDSEKSEN